ncbi:MAG: hypothetical protein WD740_06550 [Anaerolineales bacterium]
MPKSPRKSQKSATSAGSTLQALETWRIWLLGAFVGAGLALALFYIAPPDFRAQATVVVDNNLEEAWVYFPDRQLFQFLARETERLEQLAWSDEVMQAVSAQGNFNVQELRSGILQLSQPSDGGWHFYASLNQAKMAQQLAAAWALAFVDAARAAVNASPELQAARAALQAELLGAEPNEARLQAFMATVSALAEQTKGISMYTELYVSQVADLPVERSVSQSTYLFVGSLTGVLATMLWAILVPVNTPAILRR